MYQIIKSGNANSGSWNGPGSPRFNWSPTYPVGGKDYGAGGGTDVASYHSRQRSASRKTLTPEQKASIDWYSGAGYWQINPYLRTGKPIGVAGDEILGRALDSIDGLEQHIRNIWGAAQPLKKGIVVYRGSKYPDLKEGDVFTEKGFTSTSIDQERSDEQFGSSMARILVRAGTPVVYGNNYDREIMLMPNTKFRVTRVIDEVVSPLLKREESFHGYELELLK